MSSFVVEETVCLASYSAKQVRYLPSLSLEKAMEISLTNTQLCRYQILGKGKQKLHECIVAHSSVGRTPDC